MQAVDGQSERGGMDAAHGIGLTSVRGAPAQGFVEGNDLLGEGGVGLVLIPLRGKMRISGLQHLTEVRKAALIVRRYGNHWLC